VRERGDLSQELGRDVLAGDEQLDRLDVGRGDEILALDDEKPELVAPAPVTELADELELLVVARGDQLDSSAALARSATALNAGGSLTARSASTLRSSSISALLQPATNWL
jgi:hypothetical protein